MTKKTLIILAGLALVLAAPFASPLSAATKSTQIMRQLEAKSAKIVPMSKLPKALADKPRTKTMTAIASRAGARAAPTASP